MKRLVLAALVLLAAGAGGVSAQSIPAAVVGKGCTFYEHAEKGGKSFKTTVTRKWAKRGDNAYGTGVPYVGDAWNDQISSIECDSSASLFCYAFVYRDRDYQVPLTGYPNSSGSVNVTRFNDMISSFEVWCEHSARTIAPLQAVPLDMRQPNLAMRRIESVNGKIRNLELKTGETIVVRGTGFSVSSRDALQGWLTGKNSGGIHLHISDVTDTKIVARLTQTTAARTLFNRNERQDIRLVLRGDGWGREAALNLPDSIYYCVPSDKLCK